MSDVVDRFDNETRTRLFALADALGMDLQCDPQYDTINGTTKRLIELFEGYSPTICPTIEMGRVCQSAGVVAAQGQLWGNLGFVMTVEYTNHLVSLFLYDRSKAPDEKPLDNTGWSRRRLYRWLEDSVKAVYYRSVFDDEWYKLDKGPAKIRQYNEARKNQQTAKSAYDLVWGGTL